MLPTPAPPASRRSLSPQVQFLLTVGALYLGWLVLYEGGLAPDGRLDSWLSDNIAVASGGFLHVLGFAAIGATDADSGMPTVFMDGRPAVLVGNPCNGLAIYAIFAGFIVAFPGHWRAKLWFIPAGIVLLYFINIGRVAALALNHHYAHRSVDFNHHYTFTVLVYACICVLWMLWVRRYGAPAAE